MRRAIVVTMILLLAPVIATAAEKEGEKSLGTVTVVSGDVQIGRDGVWTPAAVGDRLHNGETIRTGAGSGIEILFEEDLGASVAAETQIKVTDLLLRSRLEKMRSKISVPDDTRKVKMEVTPTTGVRGTEQAEEKAEELKREHYWNENVNKAE